ncbi:MAG TPA: SRPBCC domain-containing protein [Acidimicrobiales bacterium]|nr:SRPBCC domain-containing protein [Acidimicrobiales bacterium]
MIEVAERIAVPVPPRAVFEVLADVRAVASCIPGASLDPEVLDGAFSGSLAVRFGPMVVTFRGRGTLELEEGELSGRVQAQGRDGRGGTRFHASATFHVLEEPDGAAVTIDSRIDLRGPLASVVEAGAATVAREMTAEFGRALQARLAPEPALAAAVEGPARAARRIPVRLVLEALRATLAALLRRIARPLRRRTPAEEATDGPGAPLERAQR